MDTIVQQPKPQAQVAPPPASAPVVTAPVTPQEPAKATQDDLLKRLATSNISQAPPTLDAPQVNVEMADLKDPASRQVLETRLKEANAKISKTFGEIGAEKAKLMKEIEDLKSKANPNWTPQRLQEELRRQDFIQSAQQLQAQVAPQGWEGSHEEWSALSDNDKQRIQSVISNQNQLTSQMNQLLMSQVDSQLKTKYSDYDSQKIDQFIQDAQTGRVPADQMREFVHLAMNAKRYSEQAYNFGLSDRNTNVQEKMNGATNMGLNTTLSEDKPMRQPNEHSRSYLSRLTNWNLDRIKLKASNQRI